MIADIHSNFEAFKTVLKDLENRGTVDQIWCLGDMIGYGPDPDNCIDLMKQVGNICIAGNHDLASIGKISIENFNPFAAYANKWTQDKLEESYKEYIATLPLKLVVGDSTIVHGSPRSPIWEYVISSKIATINFKYFETQFCFIGHSHVPEIYTFNDLDQKCEHIQLAPNSCIKLNDNLRYIINPGSVGQPRDGNPEASYMIFNSDDLLLDYRRIPYDISSTQQKMRDYGLPEMLIERLNLGY